MKAYLGILLISSGVYSYGQSFEKFKTYNHNLALINPAFPGVENTSFNFLYRDR